MTFGGFKQAVEPTGGGDGKKFVLRDNDTMELVSAGKLLIVIPLEYIKECIGYEGATTDAVDCRIVVVSEDDVYEQARIFNGYLKGTFKVNIGTPLVGKIVWGEPAPGKRKGWIWVDAIANGATAAVTEAEKWAGAHPAFFAEPEKKVQTEAEKAYAQSVMSVGQQTSATGRSTLDSMRAAGNVEAIPF